MEIRRKKMKDVCRMWDRSVLQPTQRVSSCPGVPEGICSWCCGPLPVPVSHLCLPFTVHILLHTCLCWGGALGLAGSPQCWIQQLFRSFILVGVTELIQEAERLQEIAVFQEIKTFWVLLPGYSFPCLFLISLSFPRNIAAMEIYLWKHFAGGALKHEWFSVKSLGKKV